MKPLALSVALLGLNVAAFAQFGRPPAVAGRVILFENANYRGGYLVLAVGQNVENLAQVQFNNRTNANDRISSVRIEGNAAVLLFESARFGGQMLRLTESVPNLADRMTPDGKRSWNDSVSSVAVEPAGRGGRGGGATADPEAVVKRVYNDLLGRDPDAAGLRTYRSFIIDQGWTEAMVRDAVRNGAEFKERNADKIITRAYQDLLGRDPDPEGYQIYRRMIVERGMTEQQVRDAIRQSPEYRNRPK
jgi:hypothetical protein